MKTAKLKQILMTLFGLLGLVCLGGFIVSKIYRGGVEPLGNFCSNAVDRVIRGVSMDLGDTVVFTLRETLAKFGQYYYYWDESLVPMILGAAIAQIREFGMLGGQLLLTVPLVLIPVAAWLKEQRWAGLVSFVGLLAAALGLAVMALSCGWTFWASITSDGFELRDYFGEYAIEYWLNALYYWGVSVLGALVFWLAAAGLALLSLSTLFGYRPNLLFILCGAMILPAVGLILGNLPSNELIAFMNSLYVNNRFFYSTFPQAVSILWDMGDAVLDGLFRAALAGGTVLSLTTVIGLLPSLDAKPLIGKKGS